MSKYTVIKFFTDLQDNSYPYNVGDDFPREGKQVSEKRIKELAGSDNRQRMPLIKQNVDFDEPIEIDEPTEIDEIDEIDEPIETNEPKVKNSRKRRSKDNDN